MAKDVATCAICGKQYKLCLSCKSDSLLKPWRSIADKAECYQVFLVLSQYNNGYIKKEEAKKQLADIKFNISELKPSVKEVVTNILNASETKKPAGDKTDNK